MTTPDAGMTARSFRIAPDVWAAAAEKAADRDETLSSVIRDALAAYADACQDCDGDCEVCGAATFAAQPVEGTAAIIGYGSLHLDSADPETATLAARAAELLAEGAVAVSVATDLDPALLLEGGEPDWDKIKDAGIRIRHVAIEDTAAFSDARMTLNPDGTIEGPVTFEGVPTGDLRILPFQSLLWEDTLPVTLKMGHDGPVIGVITALERVEGVPAPEPVTAAVVPAGVYDAGLFAQPEPGPFTIGLPDANGHRRVYGTVAPTGVCHKGKGGTCLTYRGASLDYFHSGARVPLTDGSTVRVGPLVTGGLHTDDTNMNYEAALRAVADSRSVFAMGRMFDTAHGLLFSGVLIPDTPPAEISRLQACAPSVELWPDHRGRLELKTALMVPRPGFPVAASAAPGGVVLVEDTSPVFEAAPEVPGLPGDALAALGRIEQALAMLVADRIAAQIEADQ